MSSGVNINFSDVDARMLLTKLTPVQFIKSVVSDPRFPILKVLKTYYTNKSVQEQKSVLVNDRSMPTDSEGVIQAKGKYGTIDWVYETMKFGISYEFGEFEANDLQQSEAWLQIFQQIEGNSVEEFYERIGKRLSGLYDGKVDYFNEDGDFMGYEPLKCQNGEEFAVIGGRTSGLWYQNIDGNTTPTKVDVAPNNDTAPMAIVAFLAGDKALHKHRQPSKTGNAGHLLSYKKKYLLVHPDMVTEARVMLDPNMHINTEYEKIKPLLGQYEIIPVSFPNAGEWHQCTDLTTAGIAVFTGKTHDNREVYPTVQLIEVNRETGRIKYNKTSQSGGAVMNPTGHFIHRPA